MTYDFKVTKENPLKNFATYKQLYDESIKDPDIFWLQQSYCIDWIKHPQKANESNFGEYSSNISWFSDGTLNVCYNCIDRHLNHHSEKIAIIFESDEPNKVQKITYKELHEKVCKFSNILKTLGVQKGDIVTIYLPMVPEIIYAMLACARIGAIHSVVFAGFSASALAGRLIQAKSKLLITTNTSNRGGRVHSLQTNFQTAISENETFLEQILLIDSQEDSNCNQENGKITETTENTWNSKIEKHSYKTLLESAYPTCDYAEIKSEDPLFVLYTSGSTGKPKGVVHSSGGYSVYVGLTHNIIFDYQESDIFFCTADIGWITGHSYGVYGPLINGTTLVLFQGTPFYPSSSRFWQIIDEHKVSVFYTAPTALRSLIKEGEGNIDEYSLKSLRLLASVGEVIDQTTWKWFFEKVGKSRCPIMDTWWQTESGGVLMCPLINLQQKPSCTSKPFFGIKPEIINDKLETVDNNEKGSLCIKNSWPGQTIGILGDSDYFQKFYFSLHNGYYTSGDGAMLDEDGDVWVLGRMDDVINVSGHRLNSSELEQAVMTHQGIAEACVVGIKHEIKGQGIVVFAIPNSLKNEQKIDFPVEIKNKIRKIIGPIAAPDRVIVVSDLPKTRSGKIVRRILRKIADGEFKENDDITTLANPSCVSEILMQFKAA